MTLGRRHALLAACALACACAVVVTATGTDTHREADAALQLIIVGCPCLVAAWRLGNDPGDRFARLLLVLGFGLAVVALSASSVPGVAATGRIAFWFVESATIALILSFPSGLLEQRADRVLVLASLALVALLYLPTLLIATDFPQPFPWSDCGRGCPANPLAVVDEQPVVVHDVILPLRVVLTVVVFLIATVRVARRTNTARRLRRAALVPVGAAATLHLLALAAYLFTREAGAADGVVSLLGYTYLLSLPLLAVAFAIAQVTRSVHAAQALESLAHSLRSGTPVVDIAQPLAAALEDPSVRFIQLDDAGATDGAHVPSGDDHLTVTMISTDDGQLAAVMHDRVLNEDRALVRAAGEIALLRAEHDALVARLGRSLIELQKSRTRLLGEADRERREIERSLHDGAQQGLVSLRIRLSMLRDRIAPIAPAEADAIDLLGDHVEDALNQIRTLAHGIYPPLLSQRGLRIALLAAARTGELPVEVVGGEGLRYPTDVEAAVYFTCMEALQNASKHAGDGARVRLTLGERDGMLEFGVRDDGVGFGLPGPGGTGLANMRDRVEAAGGQLHVTSVPGKGTKIRGHVPAGAPLTAVADRPPSDSHRPGTSAPPSHAG